jgi:CRP/FNR family transcriptional regulator, cyclic AMP receptor protein
MNNPQSLWFLENIDVTNIFCPRKQANMTHPHKTFKRGTYIYVPNQDSDKIFFLTEGRVKIGNIGEGGKEFTKVILTPGEVFGELSIIGEGKRRDFAYAMEDTEVCMITTEDMKGLFKEYNGLYMFFMKLIGNRQLDIENRLESLVFKDARTRIIGFLVEIGQKKGQKVGFDTLVKKFFTHQEVANMTATSRQTVTTVLNDLRTKNQITFSRSRLLIRDLDALAKEK